jgi:translocation and assembly module TamA
MSVGAAFVPSGGPAYADVQIAGLGEPYLANALAALALDNEACDAPAWRVNGLFDRADAEIQDALEAFGYYSAKIDSTLEWTDDCWIARFDVSLGEPVRLRTVDLGIGGEAASDPEFSSLIDSTVLVAGRPLNHGDYERLKTALNDLARVKGYVEARFSSSRIDVYPDEGAADVTLKFESGPRYSFGPITVKQQVLDPDLIDRYYTIHRGDPFDRRQLTDLYAVLVDSLYFGLVDVRPLAADPEQHEIPVLIELTPGSRKRSSYGGGFATDTGPRFRFTRTNRRVNPHGAQRTINFDISPVVSEFSIVHRLPYGDPRTEWLSFNAGLKHEDTDSFTSDSVEFGARQVVKRSATWQETRFLKLLVENYEVADAVDRTRLLQPGVNWLRVHADNPIRPDRGNRLFFEVSGASDVLGSQTSFVRIVGEARWIRTLPNRARVLTRLRAGAIGEHDFDALPPSVRFFAGGDQSVRGYGFESLGPVDDQGNVVGGDRLAVGSVEYEHPVKARWSVAAFYDTGNAFRSGKFDPVAGTGLGARWRSPLGPIRFDVAKALDGERDVRLHIWLGPDL